jgi:Raf kinase inhibitor-like YbhB/YbcL family protein
MSMTWLVTSVARVRSGQGVRFVAVATVAVLTLTGCRTGPGVKIPILAVPTSITVTSSDFTDGGSLPQSATCAGGGAFPALTWQHLPGGTAAVAVIVYDLDGPHRSIYVHRIITDLTPAARGLPSASTPVGAVEYTNSAGTVGWTPPCPAKGSGVHHYVFWVLALDRLTRVPPSAQTETAIGTITEAAFAQGQITGTVDAGS